MAAEAERCIRGMRWGMSMEQVSAAECAKEWGRSEDALGYHSVDLDWGGEELRDSVKGTYVVYLFDERGLCGVQFPSRCMLGDAETAGHLFRLARDYLTAIHGKPELMEEAKLAARWRAGGTLIEVRVDEETDGPREMGMFGFHYHYPMEHYDNPVVERYLRVVYSRK